MKRKTISPTAKNNKNGEFMLIKEQIRTFLKFSKNKKAKGVAATSFITKAKASL
jgi:hypothetical protein